MSLAELQELERTSVIGSYARMPVEFVRGEGARLWDDEGNEYLDFLCGISVTSLGHCHPRVVAAVREQVGRLMHASNLFYTEPAMRLAARLSRSSLGGKVFFCNSGAEANEAAIKLARKARPGGDVVVVHGAFHGRTYGALSATPQEAKQAPFAPLVPGFRAVAPEPEALRAAVDARTAAVLLEPIQGESGVHVLSAELLQAAREACDEHGAALIFDEVQCGMGRTGTLWAYEQTGVRPDAMTVAKALGGGLPIGALVTGERLADVLAPGDHGSTFAGGPVIAERRARGARADRRPGAAGARARARRSGSPPGLERLPARALGARARADARVRARRACARGRPPRAARAAARAQRHRPRHAAAAAAADVSEARGRGGARAARAARSRAERCAARSADGFELDDDPARIDVDAVHAFISGESYWGRGRARELIERAIERLAPGRRAVPRRASRSASRGRSPTARSAYLADVYVLPGTAGAAWARARARDGRGRRRGWPTCAGCCTPPTRRGCMRSSASPRTRRPTR